MTTLLTSGATRGREALDDDVDLARDRLLVTRAQSGDRDAFDDLYMRYYRRLYRFCLRRLHDTHEAEDVAQEAFARAWRALPTFGGDRRFYPWLSVIASHLCTDVLRRRNRSTPVAEFHQSNVASTEDGGEELMLAAVDSAMVAKAFTRLSDRHQRILHLREGSGWSYQRIADHEGVGITAVETLLWRARQALKREFATLAGADGRMGAWLGGALSLAALRRLMQLPARAMRRAAATGTKGAAVAAGSVVATAAMVIGATLSTPAPPVNTVAHTGGSLGHISGSSTSLPLVVPVPTGLSTTTGDATGTGGSTGSGPLRAGSTPVVPPLVHTPLGTTVQQVGGTLQQVGGTLQGVTGQLGDVLNGLGTSLPLGTNTLLGTVGSIGSTVTNTVNGVTGTGTPSGSSSGGSSGVGSSLSNVTGTVNGTVGNVTNLLGGG